MLIGGLWHGAMWKFVFWGAMHGLGLAVHKASKPLLDKIPDNFFTTLFFGLITFIYVSLLWVFFRAADFHESVLIINNIFVDFDIRQLPEFWIVRREWCVMMLVLIVAHFLPETWAVNMERCFLRSNWAVKMLVFLIVVQLVIQYMSEEVAPFIYFQF